MTSAEDRAGLLRGAATLRVGAAGLGIVGLAAVVGPAAVVVRTRWEPLADLDETVSAAAERAAGGPVTDAAQLLTHLGDPLLMTVLSAALAAALWARGARRLVAFVVLARLGAALLSTSLKTAVDRARPLFDVPVAVAPGASFPSGHALAAAAFWSALAVVLLSVVRSRASRPALLLLAVAPPVVVAATRVLLGVHYLSDVLAGLLLGWGWVAVCTTLFVLWRQETGRQDTGRQDTASPVELLAEGLEPEVRS